MQRKDFPKERAQGRADVLSRSKPLAWSPNHQSWCTRMLLVLISLTATANSVRLNSLRKYNKIYNKLCTYNKAPLCQVNVWLIVFSSADPETMLQPSGTNQTVCPWSPSSGLFMMSRNFVPDCHCVCTWRSCVPNEFGRHWLTECRFMTYASCPHLLARSPRLMRCRLPITWKFTAVLSVLRLV